MKKGKGIDLRSEKGIALMVAVTSALVALVLTVAVLNLSTNRFAVSFLSSDHAGALQATEAGIRYVFSRLEVDTTYQHNFSGCVSSPITGGLAQVVRHAQTHGTTHSSPFNRTYFVITSLRSPTNPTIDGAAVTPDIRTDNLFMGNPSTRVGREVTVWIASGLNGAGNPEFRVRAFSDYGD
ncbi:MAG: hypothetical protein NC819_02320 [Candidatus Omnitrophica bacterium]|nr:hypothetical protein [Candidatus Omnitrophota bacterium]